MFISVLTESRMSICFRNIAFISPAFLDLEIVKNNFEATRIYMNPIKSTLICLVNEKRIQNAQPQKGKKKFNNKTANETRRERNKMQ